MDNKEIAQWMLSQLNAENCLYQEDVVDYLVKLNCELFLIENSDGNQALNRTLLAEFNKLTKDNVVWVTSGRYWRFRVAEDESGRNARG